MRLDIRRTLQACPEPIEGSAMVRASLRMRWKARALMPSCDMAARSRLLPESSSRQYSRTPAWPMSALHICTTETLRTRSFHKILCVLRASVVIFGRGTSMWMSIPRGDFALRSSRRARDVSREKAFIIVVAPDPEPRDCITLPDADSTVPARYSHRPDILLRIDAFETQRRMKRILCPQAAGFYGPALISSSSDPYAVQKDGRVADFITGRSPSASHVLRRFPAWRGEQRQQAAASS